MNGTYIKGSYTVAIVVVAFLAKLPNFISSPRTIVSLDNLNWEGFWSKVGMVEKFRALRAQLAVRPFALCTTHDWTARISYKRTLVSEFYSPTRSQTHNARNAIRPLCFSVRHPALVIIYIEPYTRTVSAR